MSRRRDIAAISAASKVQPTTSQLFTGPITNAHMLDRTNPLDHLMAVLEDPRMELAVGLVAGGCALFELAQDFDKIGAHHAVFLVTLIHALKALSSVIKESRTVVRGISKSYHARFHN